LQYISAKEAKTALAPLVSDDALLAASDDQQFIFVYANQYKLTYLRSMLDFIDVDGLSTISFAVVPIEHTDPADVVEALQTIFGLTEREPDTAVTQPINLTFDELRREVMIIAQSSSLLDTAIQWVAKLDMPTEGIADQKISVYSPIHRESSAILRLVQSMLPETLDNNALERAIQRASIVGDDDSNSILILADESDARRLRRLFSEFDKPSTRIEVRAKIIEVVLNDNLDFGASWQAIKNIGEGYTGVSRLFSENLSASSPAGFNYLVLPDEGGEQALYSALSSAGVVNLVASPYVAMLSGGSAFIRAGESRPVPIARVVGATRAPPDEDENGGEVPDSPTTLPPLEQLQTEYRDIGLSLKVTAYASRSDVVNLIVEQDTTDVGPLLQVTPEIQANIFLERALGTIVTLPSGTPVVLSRLQRENAAKSNAGIPFLRSLPLVGSLFSNRRMSNTRTERLVILSAEVLPINQPVGSAANEYITEITKTLDALAMPLTKRPEKAKAKQRRGVHP
jgi:general secretion pathway protein D